MRDYFAYGLNMDVAGMAARCPDARLVGTARLARYRFAINRHGVATVLRSAHETVWGALWRIDAADEVALDRFERVEDGLYVKRRVSVRTAAGGSVRTLVYVARERRPGSRARLGYLEQVLAAARDLGLPEAYVARLERGRGR